MAHYDFNKQTYYAVTLRINRNTYPDIVEFLSSKESINGYLVDLIRDAMNRKENVYELIETVNGKHFTLACFPTLEGARDFLEWYVRVYPEPYPVEIVRKYHMARMDGTPVTYGERVAQHDNIEEDENNAE